MLKFSRLAGILAAALLALMWIAPAQAQATRTWISGVGDDANPCSRTAPCKTFPGAISKTAAGGEIDCLDPAGYGGVTVVKSITLDCGGGVGGQVGSILVSGTPGITVNGAGVVVQVRNMTINGVSGLGTKCINFVQGASLYVEHVAMFGFGSGTVPCIDFEPTVAGAKIFLRDVEIQANTGQGILIKPVGGVATTGLFDAMMMIGNGSSALTVNDGATISLRNSTISGNTKGIVVATSGIAATVNLYQSIVATNSVSGIATTGTAALPNSSTVTLFNSGIYNNGTGAGTGLSAGANTAIISFTNNAFGANAGNAGAASSTVPAL